MRKEMDLKVEQSIDIVLHFSEKDSVELARMYKDHLKNETRAVALELVGPEKEPGWKKYSYVKEWEIDDLKLKVGMTAKD